MLLLRTFRTASDIITRVTPLMIMLTPTSVPIAQAELEGQWKPINSARSDVTRPSNRTRGRTSRGAELEVKHEIQHALDEKQRCQQEALNSKPLPSRDAGADIRR